MQACMPVWWSVRFGRCCLEPVAYACCPECGVTIDTKINVKTNLDVGVDLAEWTTDVYCVGQSSHCCAHGATGRHACCHINGKQASQRRCQTCITTNSQTSNSSGSGSNRQCQPSNDRATVYSAATRTAARHQKNAAASRSMTQNQALQLANDNLSVQVKVLQSEQSAQMFLYGAATIGVGGVFGFMLGSVMARRQRRW